MAGIRWDLSREYFEQFMSSLSCSAVGMSEYCIDRLDIAQICFLEECKTFSCLAEEFT